LGTVASIRDRSTTPAYIYAKKNAFIMIFFSEGLQTLQEKNSADFHMAMHKACSDVFYFVL